MINYVPLPGSTPARVVAHLQELPPGTDVPTAVLADVLDLEAACVPSCLEYAVKNGVLAREKRGTRIYWRLGNGVPPAAAEDDDPPMQRTVKTNGVALPDIPRWPSLDTLPPPAPPRVKRGPKPGATTTQLVSRHDDAAGVAPLRIALWSDGQFVIERDGERIEFSRNETQQIVGYLDRLGERIE